MFDTSARRETFTTSDGVRLSYLEAGSGPPLLLLHGWSQGAALWHAQIEAFSATHRVIAPDLRGHGASDKPDFGYRIARLSQDVRELMLALGLSGATLMGHSMGCSVALGLYDLYGADRLARLVLFDEGARLCSDGLAPERARLMGAPSPAAQWFEIAASLERDGEATTRAIITSMMTAKADPALLEAVIAVNLQFPRALAATLLISNVTQDWSDVYRRIAVPTLVIGAEAGAFPLEAMRWQADEIAQGTFAVIGAQDGGSHFAFVENPAAFNGIVARFLEATARS